MSNEKYQAAINLLNEIHAQGIAGFKPKTSSTGVLRQKQLVALRQIIEAVYDRNYKYIVLNAPTGSGKSLIAAVFAAIYYTLDNGRTNITTSSIALQDQYAESLVADNRFKVAKGSDNYSCSFFYDQKQKGVLLRAGQSPCQDDEKTREQVAIWNTEALLNHKLINKQVKTVHEDQDNEIHGRAKYTYADVSSMVQDADDKKGIPGRRIKKLCKESGGCSYYQSRIIAERAPVVIRSIQHLLFYIMFCVSENKQPILQARRLHIHDECHSIEGVFREFFSCVFSEGHYHKMIASGKKGAELKYSLNTDSIEDIGPFTNYKADKGSARWTGADVMRLSEALYKNMEQYIEAICIPKNILAQEGAKFFTGSDIQIRTAKDYLRGLVQGTLDYSPEESKNPDAKIVSWYKNLHHAFMDMAEARRAKEQGFSHKRRYCFDVKKVKDDEKGGSVLEYKVTPLALGGMVDRYLGEDVTVFMSATPLAGSVFEKMFGLEKEVAYINIESDFPVENSPIFWDPVAAVTEQSARSMGVGETEKEKAESGWKILHSKLAGKIEEIVNRFDDAPGLVLCTSYSMVKELKSLLESNPRYLWSTDGKVNKQNIVEFKKMASEKNLVLVSAGIAEGHSFEQDISRFQIIPKVPFPVSDVEMEALKARWGSVYYNSKVAMTLQQMAGRSMRSSADYCMTVVLDQKFEILKMPTTAKLYSKHFLESIRWDDRWENYKYPMIDSANFS